MRPGLNFIPKRLQKRPFSTSAGATLRRSYLYVPSTSDRMLDKSLVTDSDAIIYDLEDSVPPSPIDKTNARIRLSNFLLVRVRNFSSSHHLTEITAEGILECTEKCSTN